MLTVGLTGGIASGKSTIAARLADLGALSADTDIVARKVMMPGTKVFENLVRHFGKRIIAADGAVDRKILASIIFSNVEEREFLNKTVHPPVVKAIGETLATWKAAESAAIGVVQVPLLIEANMIGMFDIVVVVVSNPEQQIARLTASGFTMEEGLARLRAQLPDSERLPYADYAIINKGDLKLLDEQVPLLYGKLMGT